MCCPALLAACGNHSGEAEHLSGIGLKLFGFIAELVFAFIQDMCRAETEAREDDQSKKPLQAYGAVTILARCYDLKYCLTFSRTIAAISFGMVRCGEWELLTQVTGRLPRAAVA